jgi:hypothetical protein
MKYNGIPTHVKLPYGEVEDYTVNITAGAADNCTICPSSLSASGTPQLQIYHGTLLRITWR